jgi:HAD superfamily hydrolase (TIGR01549 family)
MRYDGVLLDNDGVLTAITDPSILRRAVVNAFNDMGVPDPDPADVAALTIGVTPDLLGEVTGRYDLDPESFWIRRDLHSSLIQERELRAGRKPLYEDVEVLAEVSVPLAVVSSNQHRTIETILEYYGLANRVHTYYGRELTTASLARKKPATDYLDLAIADLGVSNPLFVGDSQSDVEAAHNAGIDSAFLRRAHRRDERLSIAPTYEIQSLRALPTLLDGAIESTARTTAEYL